MTVLLDDRRLLNCVGRGRGDGPVERALTVLAAAGHDPDELVDWTLADRDRALLGIRGALLGDSIPVVAPCGACGELLEFELSAAALRALPRPDGDAIEVHAGAFAVTAGPPTSRSLAAALAAADPDAGYDRFLRSCVRTCSRTRGPDPVDPGAVEPEPVDPGDLPAAVLVDLEAALLAAEPLLAVSMATTCPACGADGDVDVDLGHLVVDEVTTRARRLLRDVHALATAYGWTEEEVLALPRVRREAYLEAVEG